MGKLAQRFNLNQAKRKQHEQAATPDHSGKASILKSQSHPVQLPGSQVLRRKDASDFPVESPPVVAGALNGPRSRRAPSFGAPSGLMSLHSSAPTVSEAVSQCFSGNNSLLTN